MEAILLPDARMDRLLAKIHRGKRSNQREVLLVPTIYTHCGHDAEGYCGAPGLDLIIDRAWDRLRWTSIFATSSLIVFRNQHL